MQANKRQVFWPTVTLAGLLAATQGHAQETAPTDAQNERGDSNQTIVVTASRTRATKEDSPQTVRIISEEEINQQLQITSDSS